jgi:hypothetical protein
MVLTRVAYEHGYRIGSKSLAYRLAEILYERLQVQKGRDRAARFADDGAMIVRLSVEIAIQSGLDALLEGLKCESDSESYGDLEGKGQVLSVSGCECGYGSQDGDKNQPGGCDGQEKDEPALHDKPNVHQPMADDRVG